MPILKEISKARTAYFNEKGRFPSRLIVCPDALERLKARLFLGTRINPKDIPLSKYDRMKVQVKEDHEGWSLE